MDLAEDGLNRTASPGDGEDDQNGREGLLRETESVHQSSRAGVGSGLQVRDRQRTMTEPGGRRPVAGVLRELARYFQSALASGGQLTDR